MPGTFLVRRLSAIQARMSCEWTRGTLSILTIIPPVTSTQISVGFADVVLMEHAEGDLLLESQKWPFLVAMACAWQPRGPRVS